MRQLKPTTPLLIHNLHLSIHECRYYLLDSPIHLSAHRQNGSAQLAFSALCTTMRGTTSTSTPTTTQGITSKPLRSSSAPTNPLAALVRVCKTEKSTPYLAVLIAPSVYNEGEEEEEEKEEEEEEEEEEDFRLII
jgi:hypothetical protein